MRKIKTNSSFNFFNISDFLKAFVLLISFSTVFFFSGCSNLNKRFPNLNLPQYRMTTTGVGAATGGALGGGVGAVIGSASGNAGEGALLGAVSGGTAGAVIANQVERGRNNLTRQHDEIKQQNLQIQRLNQEIEELRSLSSDSSRASLRSGARPKIFNQKKQGSLNNRARSSVKNNQFKEKTLTKNTRSANQSISDAPVYSADAGKKDFNRYLSKVPVRTARREAEPVNLKAVAAKSIRKGSSQLDSYRKTPTQPVSSYRKNVNTPYYSGNSQATNTKKLGAEVPVSKPLRKKPVQVASISPRDDSNIEYGSSIRSKTSVNEIDSSKSLPVIKNPTQLQPKKIKKISSGSSSLTLDSKVKESADVSNAGVSNNYASASATLPKRLNTSSSSLAAASSSSIKTEPKKVEILNINPTTIRKVKKSGAVREELNEKNTLAADTQAVPKKIAVASLPPQDTLETSSTKKHTSPSCLEAENEAARAREASSDADKLFYFRRALRLCGESSSFHYETGRAYLSIGREEDAAFEFRAAVELDPQNQAAKQMLSSLGQ